MGALPHTSCGNGCNRPNNAPLTGFATRPDPAGCCSKLLEHHANVLCAGGWPGPALVPPRAIKPVTTLLCMAGIEELTHYSLSWWARCVQNLFAIQCPGTASVVGHSPTCCASAVPHHECIVPCGNPVIMHPITPCPCSIVQQPQLKLGVALAYKGPQGGCLHLHPTCHAC